MYWKTGFKSNFKKHFETTREFLFFLSRRAQNDTIFRVAASLSYTSLIAVVPLFAIGLAIFSAFPVFDGVKEQVKEFLLRNFVPTIEQEVSQYFAEFIDAAAQLTTIGVVGIAITAILMLSTIENSLNFIFKVTRPRRLTTKITLYWTVITLGPLLLGTAFSLRGYLFTLQKFGTNPYLLPIVRIYSACTSSRSSASTKNVSFRKSSGFQFFFLFRNSVLENKITSDAVSITNVCAS